jgi:hypothetical protein
MEVFCFRFPFAANKWMLPFSDSSVFCKNIYCRFKTKTEAQAIFLNLLPFAHRANRSLSFVRLLTEKEMEVIHSQTD